VTGFTEEHIGRTVIYTGRSGKELMGVIQGLSSSTSSQFLDLKLDNSKREHFFVPGDACVLVPDELAPLLGDGDTS